MLITANQITKYHNDKCIFKDISFSIEEQEKIAVIGVNGTGKSTFLKILAGLENYEGAPLLKKRELRISYLPQNPAFNDTLSILEQMHESIQDDKVEDFEIKSVNEVKYKINLETAEDIDALFKMTPYYYKTSATDQEKIKKLDSLSVCLEFVITEYLKEK